MKQKEPNTIKMTEEEVNSLCDRVERLEITEKDASLLLKICHAMIWFQSQLEQKKLTIKKLKRIFDFKSEKFKDLFKKKKKECNKEKTKKDSKKKGHGKRAIESFEIKSTVHHRIEGIKPGDLCKFCLKGKMYPFKPGAVLKIVGSPSFSFVKHTIEKMRCNACGGIVEAKLSPEVNESIRGDASARAIAAMLKFQGGMPYFRTSLYTENFNAYLSASELWAFTSYMAKDAIPIYNQLIKEVAQQKFLFTDDTTVRILELMEENKKGKESERKGMYTSAVQGESPEGKICVYFSGRNTAGENMDNILDHRIKSLDPAKLMADALRNNDPKRHEVDRQKCMMHARRCFVDIIEAFPKEGEYALNLFGRVYQIDGEAKDKKLNDKARLKYHKRHSRKSMRKLYAWCFNELKLRKVEPNSGLGKAMKYILKHWKESTKFYEIQGAELDNGRSERQLKRSVTHRKNSLFYKTLNGSEVGDICMSLIETAREAKINCYHYFVSIGKHTKDVYKNAEQWLPWNYEKRLEALHPT